MVELMRRRVRETTKRADAVRIGDGLYRPRGGYSPVLAIVRETTLGRGFDAVGRWRMLRIPTLRFTLADGSVDWEYTHNRCDVLEVLTWR